MTRRAAMAIFPEGAPSRRAGGGPDHPCSRAALFILAAAACAAACPAAHATVLERAAGGTWALTAPAGAASDPGAGQTAPSQTTAALPAPAPAASPDPASAPAPARATPAFPAWRPLPAASFPRGTVMP